MYVICNSVSYSLDRLNFRTCGAVLPGGTYVTIIFWDSCFAAESEQVKMVICWASSLSLSYKLSLHSRTPPDKANVNVWTNLFSNFVALFLMMLHWWHSVTSANINWSSGSGDRTQQNRECFFEVVTFNNYHACLMERTSTHPPPTHTLLGRSMQSLICSFRAYNCSCLLKFHSPIPSTSPT